MKQDKKLYLTLKLPGSVNHIYGRNKFGSTYLKKEGKDYKKEMIKYIQEEVQKQNWIKLEDTFIYLDEVVYMNKKGRDADNLKKLTQDCITESNCVWTDDTYCWSRTQRVLIDKNKPRIELCLSNANVVGIFDSQLDYNLFLNEYCNQCKKDKNKCTIHKNALESRIQDEIITENNKWKCLRYKN